MARKYTLEQMREFTKRMWFNQHLGIEIAKLHRDGITISLELRDEFRNVAEVLHGGVTATLADAAVGMALVHHFGGAMMISTVELKVNYFRPIWGKHVTARAKLLRVGKQICVGSVEIHDDAKKLAGVALVTYMVLGPREQETTKA
jgi:uncharacterized protein (TIGR00369 family)